VKLYLRFYLALLASLLVFAAATIGLWQFSRRISNVPLYIHAHIVMLLLVLVVGITAFPIIRQIAKRLERLQRGVESFGAGDFKTRVRVEGRDEVAQLAVAFNHAASRIEELVEAHKRLLANASHELRTPLTRIRMAVELMQGAADPSRTRGLEQDIAELDGLIDEILLASRLDAVTDRIAQEEVDLLALAAEECARYEGVQLEGAAASVRGDVRLLRRVLRNLLDNAARHGAPPTRVHIAPSSGGAVIRVWDHGPGIAPAELESVFRPFYRPADAASRSGTGLGLALVRQIARLHGGDAQCTMQDGRCCFSVTLPA
jgi:signal transduction histidine kinase